jgi:hypothetical protein
MRKEGVVMEGKLAAIACAVFLNVSASAFGQVYETRDAEGNPVFSDSPSQGAEEISLPQTNVSDTAWETTVPGGAPPSADSSGPQTTATSGGKDSGKVVVIGDDDDAQRENEFIDNEGRREVLDAERPKEVLEAEHRREVR